MSYSFKEIFLTLQGEGGQVGRVAVFARFAGCNLWSGREQDRAGAACDFCDTDFVGTDGEGGGRFESPEAVVAQLLSVWGAIAPDARAVVFTGGEPLLQLDAPLISAVKAEGFHIAVETNGTLKAPSGIDWICVSPKGKSRLQQTSGHELKLVWPQVGLEPKSFIKLDFQDFRLQPKDGKDAESSLKACLDYCLAQPKWRLSLQTHKMIGVK